MKVFLVWCSLMAALLSLVLLSSGCAAAHPAPPPKPTPVLTHPGQTPPELKHVATGLDWLIVISVIGIGVGAGLYFFAPVAHSLAFAVAGTAASIEGAALVTRVSLWFIPWIALGLGVLAGTVLVYEVWKNRKKLAALIPTQVQLTHTA